MLKKAIACGVKLTTDGLTGSKPSHQANDYPIDVRSPLSVNNPSLLNQQPGEDPSRQPRRSDVFHYTLFDESKQELQPDDTGTNQPINSHPSLANYDKVVVEEIHNEAQTSDLRTLHLTPELSEKFPDTQAIYDCLYKC
jgi:hypothetical protein